MRVLRDNPIPRIAVVLPVYNTAMYLEECLSSICDQTYSNFVIFAVDDGSTDCSLKILRSYEKKDLRIRVYSKENGGVSSARNVALDKIAQDAEGFDLVCFVDSDDIVGRDFFKLFANVLSLENADYIVCGWKAFNKNGIVEDNRCKHSKITVDQNGAYEHFFNLGEWKKPIYSSCSRFILNKSFSSRVALSIRFNENLGVSEDQDYIIRALSHISKGVICPEANYLYRLRSSSLAHNGLKVDAMYYYDNLLEHFSALPPSGQEGVLNDIMRYWWLSIRISLNNGTYDRFKEKSQGGYMLFKSSPYASNFSNKVKKRLLFYSLGEWFLRCYFSTKNAKNTPKAQEDFFD